MKRAAAASDGETERSAKAAKAAKADSSPAELLGAEPEAELVTGQGRGPHAARGVLTEAEAAALVGWAAQRGFSFGWGRHDADAHRRRDFRSAHTVELDDEALSSRLWARLRGVLPAELTVADTGDCSADGVWRAAGLHKRLLFVEYRAGGHFSPHADGFFVTSLHERSLFTCLIYLNSLAASAGGETQLLAPAEPEAQAGDGSEGEGPVLEQDGAGRWRGAPHKLRVTHSQRPVCGSALCFFGTALHEGAPVLDETQPKYLLRADVLYHRQRPRDAPPESADDRAAFVRPKPSHMCFCFGMLRASAQLSPSPLCCVLHRSCCCRRSSWRARASTRPSRRRMTRRRGGRRRRGCGARPSRRARRWRKSSAAMWAGPPKPRRSGARDNHALCHLIARADSGPSLASSGSAGRECTKRPAGRR